MSNFVQRPQVSRSKISSKDEFELCYLRHRYIRKTSYNPTEQEMRPFLPIINNISNRTYAVYKTLFRIVGFSTEDIVSINSAHLISFLGLYGITRTPEKFEIFRKKHIEMKKREPNEVDILNKDKANLTSFLKQRMEDLVRICKQKARDIKGFTAEEFFFYKGEACPPENIKELLTNNDRYGYKKIEPGRYKSLKKKKKILSNDPFMHNDSWYVAVPVETRFLGFEDLVGANLDPRDNMHNKSAELMMVESETDNEITQKITKFQSLPEKDRIKTMERFIRKNKKNPSFTEEVRIAQRIVEKYQFSKQNG